MKSNLPFSIPAKNKIITFTNKQKITQPDIIVTEIEHLLIQSVVCVTARPMPAKKHVSNAESHVLRMT